MTFLSLDNFTEEELNTELEKRKKAKMKQTRFTYYLHDNYTTSERAEIIADKTGLDEEFLFKNLQSPFYEIGLICEIDPETAKIEILGISPG